MSLKKVIIAAGGTGGHVFPAQAFAHAFAKNNPHCQILFVGSQLSSNKFFEKEFPYRDVDAASFSKKQFGRSLWKNFKGFRQCLKILQDYQPDLVIGFGSFHTFPMLAAAYRKKIPIFLHEQNSIPGKVNRLFSKKAVATGITFPITQSHLKGRSQLVLFPNKSLQSANLNKNEAYQYYGLDSRKQTLLVFGGSQGAKFINELLLNSLQQIVQNGASFQILHFTGNTQTSERCSHFYQQLNLGHCVKDFEKRMDLAWQISNLVIARAGSATISELIEFETPALLIPYPHATDNHQWHNALFVQQVVKGGFIKNQSELDAPTFIDLLTRLLDRDGKELREIKNNIVHYKTQRKDIAFETFILECSHAKE